MGRDTTAVQPAKMPDNYDVSQDPLGAKRQQIVGMTAHGGLGALIGNALLAKNPYTFKPAAAPAPTIPQVATAIPVLAKEKLPAQQEGSPANPFMQLSKFSGRV